MTVLVTGASGGIGAATATAFARAGHSVVLGCNTSPAKAEALRSALAAEGHTATVCRGDLRTEHGVEAVFAAAEALLGPVEILVNNAGIAAQKQFQDITLVEWEDMQRSHAGAAFLCTKRALPAMLRAKAGCILNIASVWGLVGASCEVHYSAAKAAMVGMTRALAKELAPSGIRVNCLAPGAVDTPMLAGFDAAEREAICQEIPLGRIGTPQDVADAALFLASPAASYITGEVLRIDGGWTL